jgi:hypothetical protein
VIYGVQNLHGEPMRIQVTKLYRRHVGRRRYRGYRRPPSTSPFMPVPDHRPVDVACETCGSRYDGTRPGEGARVLTCYKDGGRLLPVSL